MGFGNDHRRLLSLPHSHHGPFLWLQLFKILPFLLCIRYIRKDPTHCILTARVHHFRSLHLGGQEDASLHRKHQKGGGAQRHGSSHPRQYLDDHYGYHSFGDGIRQPVLDRDDIQEHALQHQIEARVRDPEPASCSRQVTT